LFCMEGQHYEIFNCIGDVAYARIRGGALTKISGELDLPPVLIKDRLIVDSSEGYSFNPIKRNEIPGIKAFPGRCIVDLMREIAD